MEPHCGSTQVISLRIYIIVPFSFDSHRDEKRRIVSHICSQKGLDCYYPDYNRSDPAFDLKTEKEIMLSSAMALVDLSYERPSCYYELALVEVLDKPVTLLAEIGTPIHQTANRTKIQFYSNLNEYTSIVASALDMRNLS